MNFEAAENTFATAAPAAPPISTLQTFYWSVRRELWEYRSIYIAPLVAAGLVLFGYLIGLFYHLESIRTIMGQDPQKRFAELQVPYNLAAAIIMITSVIVGLIYSLDTLYGERRDRSILFWKSLPVSDLTAVLAKASIPLVVIPFVFCVIFSVTWFSMLLLGAVSLMSVGLGFSAFGMGLSLIQLWLLLLYHLITAHVLWYAPIYGWLLLVSAWARRAPLLWAVLPPLAIVALERIALNSMHFMHLLNYRFQGGPGADLDFGSMNPAMQIHFGAFLHAPGLWTGLALTVVLLYAAARVRRSRGPN